MAEVSTHSPERPGHNTLDPIPVDLDIETPIDEPVPAEAATEIDEETDETVEAAAPAVDPAVEQDARDAGWVPMDEWRGPKEKWRPADQFLEFRNHVLPVVQRENAQLRAKVAAIEARDAARQQADAQARQALQRENLRAELRAAREEGDWDKVDTITEKMFDLRVQQVAAPQAPKIDPEVQREFTDFAGKNDWLSKDRELAVDFAIELKQIVESGAAQDIQTALSIAKRRVQRTNPDKFKPRTPGRAMAESGGSSGLVSAGQKVWANLKPEFRIQADKDIARKLYTQKDYLANCGPENFRS